MQITDRFKPASKDGPVPIAEYGAGGISILNDKGEALWNVRLTKEGKLVIHGGTAGSHAGQMLHEWITIQPVASNEIILEHPKMIFPTEPEPKK